MTAESELGEWLTCHARKTPSALESRRERRRHRRKHAGWMLELALMLVLALLLPPPRKRK
jgi:hypothetical protein